MTSLADAPSGATTSSTSLPLEGSLAIPQDGEAPVFSAPWEGQVFAAALMLRDAQKFGWPEFVDLLAKEIDVRSGRSAGDSADYYQHWLNALETLLVDKGIMNADEISERCAAMATTQRHEHKTP